MKITQHHNEGTSAIAGGEAMPAPEPVTVVGLLDIPNSSTPLNSGGVNPDGMCQDVLNERNSVIPGLLEAILGDPFNSDKAYENYAAGASSKIFTGRRADGAFAISFDLASDRAYSDQSFPGMAMSALLLDLGRHCPANGSPSFDEILLNHQDLAQVRPGFTNALAVCRFLEINEPLAQWWEKCVNELKLERGVDYICAGDSGQPGEGSIDQWLLADEAATEAALMASTARGHLMRQFFRAVSRLVIPGEIDLQACMPDGSDRSLIFESLTLPPPCAEPYYESPANSMIESDGTDSTGADSGVEPSPPPPTPSHRFGRGVYRQSLIEDLLPMTMRMTDYRSDVQATAIRSQFLARYFEEGNGATICNVRRNCRGLAGDENDLVNLRALGRHLRISGVARWFQGEVEALGLCQGVHYSVTHVTGRSGRNERLIKVTQSTAYRLCFRAPTLPGRRFRIYHMALARFLHPNDMLHYKLDFVRHLQLRNA